jgi:hypothetical protein
MSRCAEFEASGEEDEVDISSEYGLSYRYCTT